MSRQRPPSNPTPPCYAMVLPGLEKVAAEEITTELGGDVRRSESGIVVFRVPEITYGLLELRTVEDVFVLAWGTDKLSYRAEDLDKIQRWTAREPKWDRLLQIHHNVHPKPKGKPTYRLITQMDGTHGYRRVDAGKAMARGLDGKFPPSWRPAEENAAVEVWLTIQGATAVCGLRLSDRTMRHRTYKMEHLPASLRPTLAAAMVRLAMAHRGQVVLDPMCGAGTILAEQLQTEENRGKNLIQVWGGDVHSASLRAAASNLRRLGQTCLARWDATLLPLESRSVDRIVSNPPFGKQMGEPEEIGRLYRKMVAEYDRVLRAKGKVVLLVSEWGLLREPAQKAGWKLERQMRVRVLGQNATLSVWSKV